MTMKKKNLQLRVTADEFARMKQLADEVNVPISIYVRMLVWEALQSRGITC